MSIQWCNVYLDMLYISSGPTRVAGPAARELVTPVVPGVVVMGLAEDVTVLSVPVLIAQGCRLDGHSKRQPMAY